MPQDDQAVKERVRKLEAELATLRRQLDVESGRLKLLESGADVLLCRTGSYCVGFLCESLDEAVLAAELGALPDARPWITGLLNLGGELIPVIDVLGRIERRRRALSPSDVIVIARRHGVRVGLAVEETSGVRTLAAGVVQQAPADLQATPYAIGLVPENERPLIVLSIECLITESDLAQA
jgi:purine-binding chemotaxis protein CheW